MPRSTSIGHYPQSYFDFLSSCKGGAVRSVVSMSPAQTKTLRSKLYAFFSALRASESHPELSALADSLIITTDTCTLYVSPRSQEWDAEQLAAAVQLSNADAREAAQSEESPSEVLAPTITPAQLALLDKLAKLREGKKGK